MGGGLILIAIVLIHKALKIAGDSGEGAQQRMSFILTAIGTAAAVGVAWLVGSRAATFALGGIGLLLFTFVLLIRIVSHRSFS